VYLHAYPIPSHQKYFQSFNIYGSKKYTNEINEIAEREIYSVRACNKDKIVILKSFFD